MQADADLLREDFLYWFKASASPTRAACGRRWRAVLGRPYASPMVTDDEAGVSMPMHALAEDAIATLSGARYSIAEAVETVPHEAGLYAVFGDDAIRPSLGLPAASANEPLYVGKAERNLATRDLRTHFSAGRTGSSTVRRSFAALLRGQLDLRGVPRNQKNPESPAHFGLLAPDDERLTAWMHANLRLSFWVKPATDLRLKDIEARVIDFWQPPTNLTEVRKPLKMLCDARKVMANDARAWAAQRGFNI